METSIRQDQSDDWTAQFFREIEDWFREQYGCDGGRSKARRGLDRQLAARERCLGERAEAEQAIWTSRPY